MEEESEAFTILLAREDGDDDPADLGHWKVTFHAVRGELKRGDFVVSLGRRTVLRLLRCSFGYESRNDLRVRHTTHTFSSGSGWVFGGVGGPGGEGVHGDERASDHPINSLGEGANRNIHG